MPLSFDEATRRYENFVENIQDSIFTIESFMGSNEEFSFNMPQAIGNLDQVDVLQGSVVNFVVTVCITCHTIIVNIALIIEAGQ